VHFELKIAPIVTVMLDSWGEQTIRGNTHGFWSIWGDRSYLSHGVGAYATKDFWLLTEVMTWFN